MTDSEWPMPARVARDFTGFIKFFHVLGGLYIWEFVINLDYEYSIITGKRKFTWAFPVFGYSSFLFASALIGLRVSALWEHNKIVIAVASISLFVNAASYIYSMVTSDGHWTGSFCTAQHTVHDRLSTFSTFITDLILLSLMLFGVLRWKDAQRRGGIVWLLYRQGLAWVIVFTLAEVPPLVIFILNVDDPLNLMSLELAMITMSFGAARMHRGLVEHPTAKRASMKVALVKESEGIHDAGGAMPGSNASSHDPPHDWPGTQQGDRSLESDIA
ncbi:hypothetical protein BJV74DRAFT_886164 [Russula compacta]|nr:hypothetical protein BJV74DRAFT_886164 [Russula compacta]